jgi:hypothetical protein
MKLPAVGEAAAQSHGTREIRLFPTLEAGVKTRMKNTKNNEPGDEFDRIMIPEFLARPFERLGGRPAPAAPASRPGAPTDAGSDGQRYADDADPDAASAEDEQPAPRAWWAGYRGKLLLYGAGTLVMVFLQSRS